MRELSFIAHNLKCSSEVIVTWRVPTYFEAVFACESHSLKSQHQREEEEKLNAAWNS